MLHVICKVKKELVSRIIQNAECSTMYYTFSQKYARNLIDAAIV